MTIDVAKLTDFLDGRWGEVRRKTRAEMCNLGLQAAYGLSTEEHRARVLGQVRQLAQTEGPRLGFPPSVGGGGDTGAFVTSFETLGHGDLSLLVKSGVQFGLFGGAIHHLGTASHQERYLPDVMNFALPGCFAMTETGHGSDVQSIRTTATFDEKRGGFLIDTPDEDARKDYIGNAAADGRMAVVFAQLSTRGESHGVHAFLVPIRDEEGRVLPGVTVEDCGHKAGLNGVDNGRLSFDDVFVPREAMLDQHGSVSEDGVYSSEIENLTRRFFTMVGTLVQGRVSISGAAVSATKSALAIAVRYGAVRTQFSPPGSQEEISLLDFRQHQRRLLPALAKTYALHFAQEDLVVALHDVFSDPGAPQDQRRRLESLAAGIKAASTWHATHTIQTCREACGGAGYLSENQLVHLKADTDVFTTFEGDNSVLLQLVAKGLLTDYKDDFGSLDTLGMVRFVADQVVSRVVERTSARRFMQALIDAVPGNDEETDLLDRGYHLELLEWRETHIIEGVARRIKRGIDQGRDAFSVFNNAQDHVLLAARAHVDRVIFESFVAAVERCEDEGTKEVLGKLCDLHVLSVLEAERGWFLEHGRLTATRAKTIISTVNDLCDQLRPIAVELVDAFAIPDQILAAPIALGAEAARQETRTKARGIESVAGFAPPPP